MTNEFVHILICTKIEKKSFMISIKIRRDAANHVPLLLISICFYFFLCDQSHFYLFLNLSFASFVSGMSAMISAATSSAEPISMTA